MDSFHLYIEYRSVTVHSVTSNLRKSILNSLREWDLLTSEPLSYGLCIHFPLCNQEKIPAKSGTFLVLAGIDVFAIPWHNMPKQ